ncbi:MAG: hydroxyacid dehydrogenase [Spirochaetales bacterium]|nr:hydroxyacid dehydrogenase [Spirochaetales bacterium]
MAKKKALFLMEERRFNSVYGPRERAEIETLVDIIAEPQTKETIRENLSLLNEVEILFSGWGMTPIDEEFLSHAPKLEAVFYAAGTIRYFMTEAAWERNLTVTSSFAANAIPVTEYCLATILLALKQAPFFTRRLENGGPEQFNKKDHAYAVAGAYGSTVALVSLGTIGRLVLEKLKDFDFDIIVDDYDLTPEQAAAQGVEALPLKELFKRADVISLHTALLPATKGMITGELIASMKENAVLINTSRGGLIKEEEMVEVLRKRPDLTAILDVTEKEPPEEGSLLYSLPNVFLTPHIAGSMGNECRRMGQYAIDECRRYLTGEPLVYHIDKKALEGMA